MTKNLLRAGAMALVVVAAIALAIPGGQTASAGGYTATTQYSYRHIPVAPSALPTNCNGNDCTFVSTVDDGLYFKNQTGAIFPASSAASASVSPAGYTNANVTVDQYGRITSITNGLAPAGGGYTTTQNNATNLTQRSALNLIGSGVSCVDNSGAVRTDCSFTPLSYINVKDAPYNAKGDGVTDDTSAIQAAVTAGGGGSYIFLPRGNYYMTGTVTVASPYQHIVGSGVYATRITFNPASAATAIKFSGGATELPGQSLEGMTFYATIGNTVTKTAVEIDDTTGFQLKSFWVAPDSIGPWTGTNSVGLLIAGREQFTMQNLRIQADKPIVIAPDANTTIVGCDHLHVTDLYARPTPSSGNAAITINTGTIVTNMNLDGYQSYIVDKYGIYWNDSTSSTVSSAVRIQGVRCEQAVDPTGWCIYINRTGSNLQNLVLDDDTMGIAQNGVYLAGVLNATIRDSHFNANTNSYSHLTVGTGTLSLLLENNYVNLNATTSFGSLSLQRKDPLDINSAATMPATGLYLNAVGPTVFRSVTSTSGLVDSNDSTQMCVGCNNAGSVAMGKTGSGPVYVNYQINSAGAPGTAVIGGGGSYFGDVRVQHVTGQGTAPTIAAGTGAGTSPTIAVSSGSDTAGRIALTLGSSPAGSNATIGTMTFNAAFPIRQPFCNIFPQNPAAVAVWGTAAEPYVDSATSSTSIMTIKSGSTALSGGPFILGYNCFQ
jgi:Pectate lyase superfamily protein